MRCKSGPRRCGPLRPRAAAISRSVVSSHATRAGTSIEPALAKLAWWRSNFQPDCQDLANDAFLDIVAQGFDAGIRLDEAVQHDMIAMRLIRPFNAMLAASSAYLDAKGMPTTIADPS